MTPFFLSVYKQPQTSLQACGSHPASPSIMMTGLESAPGSMAAAAATMAGMPPAHSSALVWGRPAPGRKGRVLI